MLKCILVEDEKNAQAVLLHYIEKTNFITCIGVYESGLDIPLEVLQMIDFMFLDMELPELNGLAFLKTLTNPPKVIITTAYPDFAIAAFEQAAVDYMVKPFSYARFLTAVNRIHAAKSMKNDDDSDYILIYADKITHKIKRNDILYIKSELDYVAIITTTEKILTLGSLANWLKKLDASNFIQVHRSYIINTNRLKKIAAASVFIETTEIPIGSTYKAIVKNLFH
ncbi:LytTR family DNA-binding domain-containing protein [uncultured Kordia sp.]|uniref:LytR/AlgR family response regulator transcription factor n=1 Tax=uncultured Kordia sp. TaxID=507699 RepID=UPI0026160902|nr:LytTR family DNA-binding domain-containing protein [uncultured Kordia sp.]